MVVGQCTHTVLVPSPGGPVPTPTPFGFQAALGTKLSPNVKIMGLPAATVGSMTNTRPAHIPPAPVSGSWSVPPLDQATVIQGSATVFINNQPAARNMDTAITCSEIPMGAHVVAAGIVLIGG
jgi:uncharacterized Zn-binding protein involved in type VI secretion